MFYKPVNIPYYLLQYEAYARRLRSGSLLNSIESQIKNYRSGYNGERSLEPMLAELPDKNFLIFHDLRLSNNLYFFQIDYLILTSAFFLILEVKNIAGTLQLNFATHKLTRSYNGKIETFQDPTVQSSVLCQQLQDWLSIHCDSIPVIPVLDLVVFSSPGTYITFVNGTPEQEMGVIRGPAVKQKILSFTNEYGAASLNSKSFKNLPQQLIVANNPKTIDLIANKTVPAEELIKGVRCPSCSHIPMTRIAQNWHCPICGQASPKAYISALEDFRLIYGPKITNRQCKEFLGLDSMTTSKYLLRSVHPTSIGKNSNRIYLLK